MPLDLLAEIAFALLGLVRLGLIVAVPVFLLVLPAQKLNAFLRKKFRLSWILAAFSTAFVVLTPLVFVLYLAPYFTGFLAADLGFVPEMFQLTGLDLAMAIILTIVKNLLSALFFSILLMPLLFFASFAEEKLKEKLKMPALAYTFVTVFLTSVLAWLILLFALPWLGAAIIWKLFWSPI